MSSPAVSLPLILMSSITVYCEYWSETQAARATNLAASCLVHQSRRLPLASNWRPFVVEAVGQFVADGGAGVAVVGRVVHFGIVQRRLQDTGGEVDVVHLRVVIGVDGGGRHLPLGMVHGLADFGQLALGFEDRGALHVGEEIAADDIDGAVVAPLFGIADLVDHAVQLDEGLLFGGGAHPVDLRRVSPSMALSISLVMARALAFVSGVKVLATKTWPRASPRSRST